MPAPRPTDERLEHQVLAHTLLMRSTDDDFAKAIHACFVSICSWVLGRANEPPPTYDINELMAKYLLFMLEKAESERAKPRPKTSSPKT